MNMGKLKLTKGSNLNRIFLARLAGTSVFATFNSILDKVIIRPKSLVGVRLGVST
jgi:hypothetical protein